jgi:uncharacterized repeat protein (TIGR01451 family)
VRVLVLVLLIVLAGGVLSGETPTVKAATFTVTNTTDCNGAGCGSLRRAINDANASAGPHTISITATGTLALATDLPDLSQPATIVGPGQANFTISSACASCDGIGFAANATVSGISVNSTTRHGIYTQAGSTVTLRDVTVSNVAQGGILGTAIIVFGGGTMTLEGVTVTDNTNPVMTFSVSNNGNLTVLNSTISNNRGGISNGGAAAVTTIRNSNILNNGHAGFSVGAGLFNTSGTVTIENSLIAGNISNQGAGVANGPGNTGVITVSNSTFYNNTAVTPGGTAAAVVAQTGTVNLHNVTVTGNRAPPTGGSVGVSTQPGTSLRMQNTIVANNTGIQCTGGFFVPVTSLGNNLASDGSCNLAGAGDRPNTPPGFATGAAANNGGPTQTVALAGNSAAIDAGSNAAATCGAGSFDQRGTGFPRVLDANGDGTATCDIGAFELAPSADVAVTKTVFISTIVTGANATFLVSVRNFGPTIATNIVVTDILPPSLAFVSLNPTIGGTVFTSTTPVVGPGGTIMINIPSLANGALVGFSLVAQAVTTGSVTNSVSVTASTPDPVPSNNSATAGFGGIGVPTPAPTATPTPPTPFVRPIVPQVFQNPGAIAAVAGRPPSTPQPRIAVPPAAALAPAALAPVITPPRTGDAGLLADED